MALTKEDLQAIEALLDSKLDSKLNSVLDAKLEPVTKQLDSKLESVTKQLDTKFEPINKQLDILQGDVAALKADMAHHNHMVEPQLKIIREGLEGWGERAQQIDRHEGKLENHGNRILALEYAFKSE